MSIIHLGIICAKSGRKLQSTAVGGKLAAAADRYLKGYWNEFIDEQTDNGEVFLLKTVNRYFQDKKIIVFDVGANRGQWAINCLQECPNAYVHSFELVLPTFEKMQIALKGNNSVRLNAFGLSDKSDKMEVTYYPDSDSGSSIDPLPWTLNCQKVPCQTVTGDSYCANNDVKTIQLLKIDTEGHEMKVLRGFENTIKASPIPIIQFEYGYTWLPPRFQLGDAYSFLTPLGYTIGRLFPHRVMFKEYNMFSDENFRMGNFIAVHRDYPELIEALRH